MVRGKIARGLARYFRRSASLCRLATVEDGKGNKPTSLIFREGFNMYPLSAYYNQPERPCVNGYLPLNNLETRYCKEWIRRKAL